MGNLRGTLCYIFKESVGFVRNDGYPFAFAKKKGASTMQFKAIGLFFM